MDARTEKSIFSGGFPFFPRFSPAPDFVGKRGTAVNRGRALKILRGFALSTRFKFAPAAVSRVSTLGGENKSTQCYFQSRKPSFNRERIAFLADDLLIRCQF